MPLPENSQNESWPPDELGGFLDEWREHATWYAGDVDALSKFYGGTDGRQRARRRRRWLSWWARQGTNNSKRRLQLHVPLAADISQTSADYLFGETPTFTVEDDDETVVDEAVERIEEIVHLAGLHNTFLEAAEAASAIGGVYLSPTWDRELAPHPILRVMHQDRAVPEFRFNVLTAVTFWEVLSPPDEQHVVRHLERHEPGVIFHGVYVGDKTRLGKRATLADFAATKDITVEDGNRIELPEPMDKAICSVYIPNILPNRRFRDWPLGRSDYQNVEGLFDALDEAYTSWMRDIRLAKHRILVASEFLGRDQRPPAGAGSNEGSGATFDFDQEVFAPLDMEPGQRTDGGIQLTSFEIRAEQHLITCTQLVKEATARAGYAPQTFVAQFEGSAESGTALRIRDRKSLRTTAKKGRYWISGLEATTALYLAIDNVLLENRKTPMVRPEVELPPDPDRDEAEVASTITALRAAQAMSIEIAVKRANPDWTQEQVDDEVKAITEEQSLQVPDPSELDDEPDNLPEDPEDGPE